MTRHAQQRQDSLEKMLRYILGAAPDEFGLHPEREGFVPLKALLAALRDEEGWRGVREGQILGLANQPGDRSPFELDETKIRLKPALAALPPEAPPLSALPKRLYAAFKPAAWAAISWRGLYPKTGEDVVRLWADADLALKVGLRISAPAVLVTIQALKAHQAGTVFKPYSERLWLAAEVPAAFLSGPPVPPQAVQPQEERPAPAGFWEKGSGRPAVFPEPEVHRGKKKGKHGDEPDWKNQRRRERRRPD